MKSYLCNDESTSVEHVPPKGFFPSDKRINLITVPSCSVHNQNSHLDDEYVRNFIALTKGNNEIGVKHFRDKGVKSLQKSPKLFNATAKTPKLINLIKGNDESKSLTFEVDMSRFDRVLKKIAYGLYYYVFKETWNRELVIAKMNLVTEASEIDPISERINYYPDLKASANYQGNNPEIFQFAFLSSRSHPDKLLAMKFYEFFEVWAGPRESSNAPSIEH